MRESKQLCPPVHFRRRNTWARGRFHNIVRSLFCLSRETARTTSGGDQVTEATVFMPILSVFNRRFCGQIPVRRRSFPHLMLRRSARAFYHERSSQTRWPVGSCGKDHKNFVSGGNSCRYCMVGWFNSKFTRKEIRQSAICSSCCINLDVKRNWHWSAELGRRFVKWQFADPAHRGCSKKAPTRNR